MLCHSSSLISADILERGLVGRIVDEDIDPAELIDGTFNDGAAVIWLSQVAGKQCSFAAFLVDKSLHLLGILMFIEIRNEQVGPLTGICNCHRSPDPAVSSGNDGLLACKTARSLVAFLAMVRTWLHPRRRTGIGCCWLG